jgi:hypothetical protein
VRGVLAAVDLCREPDGAGKPIGDVELDHALALR